MEEDKGKERYLDSFRIGTWTSFLIFWIDWILFVLISVFLFCVC